MTPAAPPTYSPATARPLTARRHASSPRRGIIFAIALVLVASAGVRFFHLATPHCFIFDEVYYAKDAHTIIQGHLGPTDKTFPWEPGKEVSWPHPEWGKQLIAVGILLFGYNSFGWRFMSALAGLALLALIYPLARRLGLARPWALATLVLTAADTLEITQSRIGTLDIFVALWSTACVWLALRYVQEGHRRRDLLYCGLAGGLAFGTKWSGALALVAAAIILALLRQPQSDSQGAASPHGDGTMSRSDVPGARGGGGLRRAERAAQVGRAARAALWPLVLLVALPAALYLASYWEYFLAGHTWSQWWELQHQMVTFNFGLHAAHTYASEAPTWILDVRPVWYYFTGTGGVDHGIVAIGNAFLWWAATLALLSMPVVALVKRRRDLALPPLLVAVLYFPWFVTSRTSFLYYMAPIVPFMAILVASALAALTGAQLDLRGPRTTTAASVSQFPPERDALLPPEQEGLLRPLGRPAWLGPTVLVVCGALITALLWYQIGFAARLLFWTLPGRVLPAGHVHGAWVGSWVGLAVGVTLATLGLIVLLTSSRLQRWRLRFAWFYVGAVVGWAIIYLPIVLGIGISPNTFYHLMWFASWI